MSLIVLYFYFLHNTSVLPFHIDVVLTLSFIDLAHHKTHSLLVCNRSPLNKFQWNCYRNIIILLQRYTVKKYSSKCRTYCVGANVSTLLMSSHHPRAVPLWTRGPIYKHGLTLTINKARLFLSCKSDIMAADALAGTILRNNLVLLNLTVRPIDISNHC